MKNKTFQSLTNPLAKNNPVLVQILGICSALAVTTQLKPALVMGLSVTAVCAFSNLVLSLLRNGIPDRIRILVQLVVIAALVTIVNDVLKAYVYDVSKQLSVYVGLIITNCIIMGRVEAFAAKNNVGLSALDGVGMGLGFTLSLTVIGAVRELLGTGSIFGMNLYSDTYGMLIFVLAPGAFIVLGYLMALMQKVMKK